MELSCKSEYALLAVLELAAAYRDQEPLQIRHIAALHDIPDRYLEQLLATLRRRGIIRSIRGAKGGYILAKEPWQTSLFEVMDCIEGLENQNKGSTTTPETLDQGVVREIWREAWAAANQVLQDYTLQDLCERRQAKRQLDIMYYI